MRVTGEDAVIAYGLGKRLQRMIELVLCTRGPLKAMPASILFCGGRNGRFIVG